MHQKNKFFNWFLAIIYKVILKASKFQTINFEFLLNYYYFIFYLLLLLSKHCISFVTRIIVICRNHSVYLRQIILLVNDLLTISVKLKHIQLNCLHEKKRK